MSLSRRNLGAATLPHPPSHPTNLLAVQAELAKAQPLLTPVLTLAPILVLFWCGACFVWNHFLEGPYLHDAGWYSAIIYHQGFLPQNPPAAYPMPDYYSIHASVVVSLASALSYLAPLDRIHYYCLFQGLLYAPLGWVATALLRLERPSDGVADGLAVFAASLVFALNGQVISCLGYPHYEILVSAGLCILLLGLARGSTPLAWCGVAIAAMTREDGGLHAAAFIAAALICGIFEKPFQVARKTQLTMLAVALGASAAAMAIQHTFFAPSELFKNEFLGEPAFAHLTLETVTKRVAALGESSLFVVLPFVTGSIIAIRFRDWRYLLGWAAEFPWFLVNLLAAQKLKSTFDIYTGFPFVGSIFWMGAYACVTSPKGAPKRALFALTATSAVATLGMLLSHQDALVHIMTRAAWPLDISYDRLNSFATRLSLDPGTHDDLLVDPGVASWAIETMPAERRVFDPANVGSLDRRDGIAFFRTGSRWPTLQEFVAASPFSKCGRIPETEVFLCARPNQVLPPEFIPASFRD